MNITLENLKKTYTSSTGSITAVNGVSLKIPENMIFGIIGKSGAGKSSLVRLVSLLETPDEGSVFYNDVRVDNLSKAELIQRRRKIGMIFQNFNLFSSRTAAQNIAYPLEICKTRSSVIKDRVAEMLKLVGLEDRGSAPVSTLSGGQKQRIAIARALAIQPDILFCDEATSALDPQTTHSILNLIREIQAKMSLSVVMITHQMEVVRDACESVAVIENGRVVECGKVKDIFTNPKTETTRDFIKNISLSSSDAKDGIVKWTEKKGSYLLHFLGSATGEPVLCRMAKEFDVCFNILAAGIAHLPDEDVGYMEADISGEEDAVAKAVAWLSENNVRVQKK